MARKLFPIFRFQSNITEVRAVETQNNRKQKSIIFISNVLFTIESKATTDNIYSCTHHFLRQNLGLLGPVFLWVMLIFPFSYLTPSSLSRNKENMIKQKMTTQYVTGPQDLENICASHRADRLPRPSFLATPCKILTGLAPPSLAPVLSPLLPFPFLPGLELLLLALSPSPLVAGGRERYTSKAERPPRSKSCRLLIILCCSVSWQRQQRYSP